MGTGHIVKYVTKYLGFIYLVDTEYMSRGNVVPSAYPGPVPQSGLLHSNQIRVKIPLRATLQLLMIYTKDMNRIMSRIFYIPFVFGM